MPDRGVPAAAVVAVIDPIRDDLDRRARVGQCQPRRRDGGRRGLRRHRGAGRRRAGAVCAPPSLDQVRRDALADSRISGHVRYVIRFKAPSRRSFCGPRCLFGPQPQVMAQVEEPAYGPRPTRRPRTRDHNSRIVPRAWVVQNSTCNGGSLRRSPTTSSQRGVDDKTPGGSYETCDICIGRSDRNGC